MGVLFSQVGSPQEFWDTVKGATWGWVIAAFVLSMVTKVGYAIALIGAFPKSLRCGLRPKRKSPWLRELGSAVRRRA